jgi:hypothetical protein
MPTPAEMLSTFSTIGRRWKKYEVEQENEER